MSDPQQTFCREQELAVALWSLGSGVDAAVPIRIPDMGTLDVAGVAAKSTKTEREAQIHLIDQRYDLLRTIVRTVGTVLVVAAAAWALRSFAGRSTNVGLQAALSVFAGLRIKIAVTLAGVTTLWALAERTARRRTVKRYAPYKEAEERAIDPNRSSSKLTPRGTTNPEDIR